MGPECGTAMLGGVGLGFANAVRAGPVGIVAASGTGAQEAAILLDAAGGGVSQIIGVGGRDLSVDVGGVMFKQAMRLLAADDATETLLLVSKPPAARSSASSARSTSAGSGWWPRSWAGTAARRRSTSTPRLTPARSPPRVRRRRGRRLRSGPSRGGHVARPLLRRLSGPRGGDGADAPARADRRKRGRRRCRWPPHLRPWRGGVHPGPPASDGRPRGSPRDAPGRGPRRARRLRAARRGARPWVSCRSGRRLGRRDRGCRPRSPGDRARLRHTRRSAGRAPSGGDAPGRGAILAPTNAIAARLAGRALQGASA